MQNKEVFNIVTDKSIHDASDYEVFDAKFVSDAEYLSLIDMFDVYHDNFGITYSNRRYHYYIDVSPGAKNGVGVLYEESYQKIYDAITPYIREHKINKLI